MNEYKANHQHRGLNVLVIGMTPLAPRLIKVNNQ